MVQKDIFFRLRNLYYGLFDIQSWDKKEQNFPSLGWYLHQEAYSSRKRIKKLRNLHKGQRCFIIGNGPSLKSMELSPLRKEITFGLNRIYLIFPKNEFQTTYYVAVNTLVIEQCADEIQKLNMPKFVSWHARKYLGFDSSFYYIRDPYNGTEGFALDPTWRLWEGSTVTFVAMQLGFFMGFDQIILIGIDHEFVSKGEPHSVVISEGNDFNHFHPDYFGEGFRWNLPDLDASERSYNLAKQHFERDGRKILDATIDGKLRVFPKIQFDSLF